MTHLSSSLEIKGFGCLESIEYKGNKPIVKIRCSFASPHGRGRGEQVVFVCDGIEFIDEVRLSDYEKILQNENVELIVSFKLLYQETLDFLYCRTNYDPDHIVTIKAKLLNCDFQELCYEEDEYDFDSDPDIVF